MALPPLARTDIAVVIAQLGAGGAQRVVANLTAAWVERGRRVVVITFSEPTEDFFELDRRVERVVVSGIGVSESFSRAVVANVRRVLALRRAVRAADARVTLALVGVTNILTVLATRGLRTRVVISERNDPARQSLGRAWDVLRRWTYRRADVVTAINDAALDTMSAYVPRDRLAVVPIPLEMPMAAQPAPLGGPYVLSVGRLVTQKAHDVVLRAFALLASEWPEWRLVIVGDGPLRRDLEALALALGLGERVVWTGEVDDVASWYRGAAIFAFPSRHEGVGNALLEAMFCGLPVVVSDGSPGPLEHVHDGESGLVVPVEDHRALADALNRLMSDPDLARRLGDAAQREVSPDRDAVLERWDAVLGLQDVVP